VSYEIQTRIPSAVVCVCCTSLGQRSVTLTVTARGNLVEQRLRVIRVILLVCSAAPRVQEQHQECVGEEGLCTQNTMHPDHSGLLE